LGKDTKEVLTKLSLTIIKKIFFQKVKELFWSLDLSFSGQHTNPELF
jgi:hypothetical protein